MNHQPDIAAALEVCAREPLAAVVPAARLAVAKQHGWVAAGGEVWAWPDVDRPLAVAWAGANLIPVVPNYLPADAQAAAIAHFAKCAKAWGQRCSAIVGAAAPVQALWRALRNSWPPPIDVRAHQPLFRLDTQPESNAFAKNTVAAKNTVNRKPNPDLKLGATPVEVKLTSPADLPLLLPAAVAMFTEEVGYSPVRFGLDAYRNHLANLIAEQRSYCVVVGNQAIFKADIGAVANGVAQLQGVWVAPTYRGQGIAKSALTAVIADAKRRHAQTISLYVNQHNSRAINLYRSLGFRHVGEFATILF